MKATIEGVRIAGLATGVPVTRHSFAETPEMFTAEEAAKLADGIGVHERRIAPKHMLASDLAVAAAEKLLADLDWDPASVEVLIFVTQGPDYLLPATSCLIQKRLGLPKSCAAFDVNLGCSGYVYGLWLASQLLSGSEGRRALLLCGDVSSRLLLPEDRSTRPLFGDAGAATALEKSQDATPIHVVLGTDGGGGKHIAIKAGGLRNSLVPALAGTGEAVALEDAHLHLNGPEVFTFTLRVVPALVRDALQHAGVELDAIDFCVMHQANKFILEHLRNKAKIPPEKFIVDMEKFGNTSSASIPLAICHALADRVAERPTKLLLGGFGVGWSWGGVVLDLGPVPTSVVDVPDDFPTLAL
ncbi:MAG TPA: ketoacyl-ACP synthase III [Aliidongia sp.]|nr:ketoacyl-ACP synthase III [Aliidongia sp.]